MGCLFSRGIDYDVILQNPPTPIFMRKYEIDNSPMVKGRLELNINQGDERPLPDEYVHQEDIHWKDLEVPMYRN